MSEAVTKTPAAKAVVPAETTVKETVVPFVGAAVASSVREVAEKSVKQAKESYDQFKAAAEDTTEILEESFATATKGVGEFNRKVIEAFKSNTDAQFDLFRDLVGVKTPAEAFELHNSFVRKQIAALSAQSKDMVELVKDTMTKTTKPLGDNVLKTFKQVASGR